MGSRSVTIQDIPCGKLGQWEVSEFTITDEVAGIENIRAMFHSGQRIVRPGTYKSLTRNGHVIMSNTPTEMRDFWVFERMAKGNILINGLGLGVVLCTILEDAEVEQVTVIELDADVITLVGQSFADEPRVNIIHADAFTWQPPKGVRYNCVWHDIWDNISADNLPGMARLHRKYARRCDWQGAWGRDLCKRLARREA